MVMVSDDFKQWRGHIGNPKLAPRCVMAVDPEITSLAITNARLKEKSAASVI